MPVNPNAEIGVWSDWQERCWDSKDALIYALGVGAGAIDATRLELEFTTENSRDVDQRVLPTFAVIVGSGGFSLEGVGSFDRTMIVDGARKIVLHREIPAEGRIRTRGRVTGIYDKGSGAVIASESESVDSETGEPMFEVLGQVFIRGEGGFGGDRGSSQATSTIDTDRAPDHQVNYATRADQALLYRLSGDRNPLHSDPKFAEAGGFPLPILHGLCTYGFTGRALLHTLCDSDPARFRFMEGRFSSPVLPGDQLTVSMWVEGSTAAFQTANQEGKTVLDRGSFGFA
jgi:acyl dehydratase